MAYILTLVFGLLVLYKTEAGPRVSFEDDGSPIVNTAVGSIRGLQAEDGNYSMFMGIPYAEVSQDNPFGTSTAYPKFEDTFNAFDDSAICPQIEEFSNTIVGTVDCLHLNVYVPNSVSTDPLPVMVWIYGGAFSTGFAGRFVQGPSYIVRHDVILVTLNYRLGPYGFMCLGIPEVPGNQGLKDQLIALRWIKENIAAFGGDDSRITAFGNSAGGMSIDLHLYYGQEQLFHRMIPQSGVAMEGNAIRDSTPGLTLQMVEYFNYTAIDLYDAISFLATKDAHEIIARSNEAGLTFWPCIEQEFNNVENFITTHPVNVDNERVKQTDILIGYTNDEAYAVYAFMNQEELASINIMNIFLSANFDFGLDYELFEELKEIITHFYFGDDDVTIQSAADAASDFFFNHPSIRAIQKYLDDGVENLYLYVFSYSGGRNFVKNRLNIRSGGAYHADELGYLFDVSYMEKPLDPEDQLILDRMTKLWTNFAKYGNPTPAISELIPLQWPRVARDKWNYLDIDTDLRVSTRPMRSRMAFLDLFYKMNAEYRRGFERAPSSGKNIVMDISLPLLLAVKYFV